MSNAILDAMTRQQALACIQMPHGFLHGGQVYMCPDDLGLDKHPNILQDGCQKCWERSINEYYDGAVINFQKV